MLWSDTEKRPFLQLGLGFILLWLLCLSGSEIKNPRLASATVTNIIKHVAKGTWHSHVMASDRTQISFLGDCLVPFRTPFTR